MQKMINLIFQRHRTHRNDYRPDSMLALNQQFGFVEKLCPHVLIGGTNGKGSVSVILSEIVGTKKRVGCFIGPHLMDYKERIRIDARYISDQVFLDVYQNEVTTMLNWLHHSAGLNLSFFELTLLVAILYFIRERVEFAVFEVGLGGRRDATACLEPLLSVLTNVSLEHTHILGDSIMEIAAEKSAIIRRQKKFIWAGQDDLDDYFQKECQAKQVIMQKPSAGDFLTNVHFSLHGMQGFLHWKDQPVLLRTKLKGLYQQQNMATVICACRILQDELNLDATHLKKGCWQVSHECRLETVCEKPLIIVDGSHNYHGLKSLIEWIHVSLSDYQVFVAFGIKANKRHAEINTLWDDHIHLWLYSGREKKFLTAQGLRKNYPQGRVMPSFRSIYQGFLAISSPKKALIFTGSLYLAARQKKYLEKNKIIPKKT